LCLARHRTVAQRRPTDKTTRSSGRSVSGGAIEAVRVRLLGGFSVSVGDREIRQSERRLKKAAALVKLLALAPAYRLHREQLMDLLWPDSGRKAASNSLRRTLHAARRTLDQARGFGYLVGEGDSLVLCPGGELWVDVDAFEQAAVTARRSEEAAAYRASLEMYPGELPVVLERRESHSHLAHYMAVTVQSLFGALPFAQRQVRQRLRLTMFLRDRYSFLIGLFPR
jgi:two-component SAPR family response regulator